MGFEHTTSRVRFLFLSDTALNEIEITQLHCKHVYQGQMSLIRCLENLQCLMNHRITPFTAYCGITVDLCRVSVMYWLQFAVCIQGRSLAQIRGGQCLLSKYRYRVSIPVLILWIQAQVSVPIQSKCVYSASYK